jgi:hypothetical protein
MKQWHTLARNTYGGGGGEEKRNLYNILVVKFSRQGESESLGVLIYGLCNDIFNISKYTASNDKIFTQ